MSKGKEEWNEKKDAVHSSQRVYGGFYFFSVLFGRGDKTQVQ
jgi:hypothetical protein